MPDVGLYMVEMGTLPMVSLFLAFQSWEICTFPELSPNNSNKHFSCMLTCVVLKDASVDGNVHNS